MKTLDRIDARFEKERSLYIRDQHIKVLKDLMSEMESRKG